MDSCESKRVALIRGLVEGQDMARQLHYLVLQKKPVGEDGLAAAGGVLDNILASFAEGINLITHQLSGGDGDADAGSEDSTQTKKKRPKKSGLTDDDHRSRCCSNSKKSKLSSSETWTKVSPTIEDDGHAWRKYGQKEILNSKFPRSYFRCRHKYDKGCKATKQIQRMENDEDEMLLYKTTYIGLHTCKLADHTTKIPPPPPQLIIDDSLLFLADDHFTQQQKLSSSTSNIYASSFVGLDAAATTASLLFDAQDDDFGVFFLDDPDTTFS